MELKVDNAKWSFKNSLLEPSVINSFSKSCKIDYVFATVLLNRGIDNADSLAKYIKKPLSAVNNPMLLPDIQNAADRIIKAISEKERIVIYGDYDVDGITATALLYKFLKEVGADVGYYIPDRLSDGYGMNIMSINKLAKQGTKLLITVDCGISSIGETELAKALKTDVIITDHHTCRERLPDAYAVVNPKRLDSEYPFCELAGVGVSFKLVLALAMKMGLNTKEYFDKYVSLAAIGTVSDVVSLTGENRIIVDRGLEKLAQNSNTGIKMLLKVCGAQNRPINSQTVAFVIAPRINAAGRIKNAELALKLLLSDNEEEAYSNACLLDEINRERQSTEAMIYKEALEMLSSDEKYKNKRVIVLAKEGWHQGVIGIVASKICERFYKPCILISSDGTVGKGSCRSVGGINIFSALLECEDELTGFGGHALAAGLSLNMQDLDAFDLHINKYVSENIKNEPVKTIDIDCSVTPDFITLQNIRAIGRLEPFGADNEKPVFALCGVRILSTDTMGADNKHLKMKIEAGQNIFEAVGFSMGHIAKFLPSGEIIDLAFTPEINSYQDTQRIQLFIKDIRFARKG